MPASRKKSAPSLPDERKAVNIEQIVFIPASPKKVYEAFLDGKKHTAMTGGAAKLEAFEGGNFTAWDGYISGTILELEPGKRIVQDWKTSEWPEGYARSVLSLTFKPKKNGTELHLLQECVPASQVRDYEQGWNNFYWKPMIEYFSKLAKKKAPPRHSRKKPAS